MTDNNCEESDPEEQMEDEDQSNIDTYGDGEERSEGSEEYSAEEIDHEFEAGVEDEDEVMADQTSSGGCFPRILEHVGFNLSRNTEDQGSPTVPTVCNKHAQMAMLEPIVEQVPNGIKALSKSISCGRLSRLCQQLDQLLLNNIGRTAVKDSQTDERSESVDRSAPA